MMKKGLIMELKKDYAIMLNDDGSMDKIVIKPGMAVGQKIFYFDEDIIKVSSSSQGKFKYNAEHLNLFSSFIFFTGR